MTIPTEVAAEQTQALQDKLNRYLSKQPPLAIAVSGGVDSLTMAWAAKLAQPTTSVMVHAVSPAVPPEATELVKFYAKQGNWNLKLIDANEYNDPRYRANPVNRCYFCKTNLYTRIQSVTGLTIATGTNMDDLGDYRPGLIAAEQHNAIHPYVEVGIDKSSVRNIATSFGLHEVAVLPAQPCLASRVETGISIDANDLTFINTMESLIRNELGNGDIRCRLTERGVKIEIDSALYKKALITKPAISTNGIDEPAQQDFTINNIARVHCTLYNKPYIGISLYEKGSAFIHPVSIEKSTQTAIND